MRVLDDPIDSPHIPSSGTANGADRAPVTCVILAAGAGTRIGAKADSKPLLAVAGLSLLERTIATAHEAGIDDFVVMTGFQSDRVDALLGDIRRRRRISVSSRYCEFWKRGNGASLRCARSAVTGRFLLLMADHVMDDQIIRRLVHHQLNGDTLVLAVDRRVENNDGVDLDDVTRVHITDGRIQAIGKGLERFNAFDTGAFICSPAVFDALDEGHAAGDGSLSSAVQRIATAGVAGTIDIDDASWVDVDTPAARRQATGLLYGQLAKPHDGWVSRRLNRPLSVRILTPILLRVFRGITPNQVSVMGFLMGIVGAVCLALRLPIAAAIAIHLASVLDGSDGEIARLKKLASPLGNFLDAVLDRYADAAILLGLTYFVWTDGGMAEIFGSALPALAIVTGMLAVAGTLMVSYTSTKAQADLGYRYAGRWIAAGRGRDWRTLLIAIGALLAAVHGLSAFVALALIATSTNAIVAWRTGISWRHSRSANPLVGINLKAVIFDVDGTVADTMPELATIAVTLLTQHYGLDRVEARARYFMSSGLPFRSQLEEMFPAHSRNDDVAREFEAAKRRGAGAWRPFAGVKPTLAFLKRAGIQTFLCSSTTPELVRTFVATNGLDEAFTDVLGYDGRLTKDRQLREILRRYGLSTREVVFVGDSLRDWEFAKHVGITFIGVQRGDFGADFIAHGVPMMASLQELETIWRQSRYLTAAAKAA